MFKPWMRLAVATTLLGIEAQTVMGIRLSQIALGRGSAAETQLMVSEKMRAFVEAASTVAAGGAAHTVVKGYRKHVRRTSGALADRGEARNLSGHGPLNERCNAASYCAISRRQLSRVIRRSLRRRRAMPLGNSPHRRARGRLRRLALHSFPRGTDDNHSTIDSDQSDKSQ